MINKYNLDGTLTEVDDSTIESRTFDDNGGRIVDIGVVINNPRTHADSPGLNYFHADRFVLRDTSGKVIENVKNLVFRVNADDMLVHGRIIRWASDDLVRNDNDDQELQPSDRSRLVSEAIIVRSFFDVEKT